MNPSRRTALKAISVGTITAFSGTVAWANFGQTKLRVRRALTNMPLNDPDLSTYRDFVGKMLAADQTKPVSWLGFASQHGTLSQGFKFCPHGDWYFLPWHREYVMMYENAVRALMKNPDFAMPYWNWTEERLLPQAFSDSTYNGKPNPLYIRNRNELVGSNALTDSLVGQGVMDQIYAETVYELFGTTRNPAQMDLDPKWVPAGGGSQGILERTPHNMVHNNIGAFMPTAASPRDPIFFMHHGNIDRIWAHWNALGRQNSTDRLWLEMNFDNNYIAPDGTTYSRQVKDLLDTAALGYRYDVVPTPDGMKSSPRREAQMLALANSGLGAEIGGVQRVGSANRNMAMAVRPLDVPLQLKEGTVAASTVEDVNAETPHVHVILKDIAVGDDVRGIRVFLNRDDLTVDVPDSDPHFVTTFGFLAHGAAGHGANVAEEGAHKRLHSVILDITETLKKLRSMKRLTNDEIKVQLIPVPAPGVTLEIVGSVVPASVEIASF